ncbi:aminopeptidase P family protein [Rhizobium lentis]|uniref:M24 family metallopeptidase n=1 Tax=Rhizobium lentis TaxID=1138194 RepID=UPI001C830F78|nr:Xaa-Pro peptidase family protein [Rhizobium lentis]MBX5086773.1 aminopeptidase P family protein [Rhizobium lentis]MBX5099418.1 aminopeptidase P family protein [Rhizobium lentis]MBX5124335.1 aminopeptidase P family protein [Rhizobium lentis]
MFKFDYEARIRRYQDALREEGIDFAITISAANVRYLTGFWGYATRAEYSEPGRLTCVVVPQKGTPLLVVPKIERSFAQAATRHLPIEIRHHVEWTTPDDPMDPWEIVRDYIRKSSGTPNVRLSIERPQLTERAYLPIQEAFDGFEIVTSSGILERHRDIKDEAELRLLKGCGDLASSMFNVELEAIKRGRCRECDVAMLGWQHNVLACAECIETSTDNGEFVDSPIGMSAQLLTSGPRLSRAHGTASTRVIEPTDLVAIDLCRVPFLLGYRIGFGRVISQRPLNSTEQDINATVKKSYEVGVSMLRPGSVVSEIDAAVRNVLQEGGLGDYIMHRCGRTTGIESEIRMQEGVQRTLEADMVLSFEPSIYMDRFQSRIESTFRVTNDGPELLTRVPEEMIMI